MLLTDKQKITIKNNVCWKGKNIKNIANDLCLPLKPLRKYVKDNNLIPMYKNKQWLQEQYNLYGNATVISEKTGFSQPVILLWIKKLNIDTSSFISRNRKYLLDESYFEVIDTEEKAYWLGFIMADGCVSRSSNLYEVNRLNILLKDDKDNIDLLNNFKNDIKWSGELDFLDTKNIKYNIFSKEVSLRINSKILIRHLLKHSVCQNKTGKEIIPDTVPFNLVKHFIRGFFDGDGCIKNDGRISIGSASKMILEQIQNFAKQLGCDFVIYERKEYKVPFYLIESNEWVRNKRFLDCIYGEKPKRYLKRKYEFYLSLFGPPLQ